VYEKTLAQYVFIESPDDLVFGLRERIDKFMDRNVELGRIKFRQATVDLMTSMILIKKVVEPVAQSQIDAMVEAVLPTIFEIVQRKVEAATEGGAS